MRPATPASPRTPSACRRSPPTRSRRSSRRRRSGGSTWSRSGPRRRWSPASSTRCEEAGVPAFGPSAAAAELEGSKAFAKELMKEAGVPTAGHVLLRSREEAVEHLARAAYPTVLKADGLAAGKGVIVCEDEARGARRRRRLLHRAALRPDDRGGWRSSSRARSSRCWRSATARTWCRWRRPRTTSGSSTATRGRTPAAWAATRRCPASAQPRSRRSSTASTARSSRRWQAAASPSTASSTPASCSAPTGPRCSSSTPASATPRRRRCCRGCARTWSTSSSPPASPAAWPAPAPSSATTGR